MATCVILHNKNDEVSQNLLHTWTNSKSVQQHIAQIMYQTWHCCWRIVSNATW